MRQELTIDGVVEICGNNQENLLCVAENMGLAHKGSWFVAASEIKSELNLNTADPADMLRHLLNQI